MEFRPKQMHSALNSFVRGVNVITQVVVTPITRMTDVLQRLMPSFSSQAMTRLARTARSLNVPDLAKGRQGKTIGGEFEPSVGRTERGTGGEERPSEMVTPERPRLFGEIRRTGNRFRFPEKQLGDLAQLLSNMRTATQGSSIGVHGSIISAGIRPTAPSIVFSPIFAQLVEHTSNVVGVSSFSSRTQGAREYPPSSTAADSMRLSTAATADLSAVLEPAITRIRRAVPSDLGLLLVGGSILRHRPGAQRISPSDYFPGESLTVPSVRDHAEQTPFAHYMRVNTALTRKVVELMTPRNDASSSDGSTRSDTIRSRRIERSWPRLFTNQDHSLEGSTQRGSILELLDRPEPAAAVSGPGPGAPTTVNVAINVHGVVNGDEFVRRHGYEIARVFEQVIQRRARRAY